MSDPFFSLNANNLQTISATNSRLQELNASMTKPLMASHPPQLPQQQIRPMAADDHRLTDRQKFEKQRKFELQQKRLQEMSFSKAIPTQSSNSSADQLMANLIQKVESDAKFNKRLNQNHRPVPQAYNQMTIQPSVASSIQYVPNIIQTSTASYTYPMATSVHNMMTVTQQIPQTSGYFNSYYPSNQLTQPSVHQIPNSSVNSGNYSTMNAASLVGSYGSQEKSYQYIPNASSSQSLSSAYTSCSVNQSSDPIFSITTTNGYGSGVTHINTEPIPSTVTPPTSLKLPPCFEDVFKIPTLYLKVWNYVKVDEISTVCDTNKLYPVLLSVGLPQTTLAQLWSVVNQTIPGQLTRHELNMALALIALLQKGCVKPLEEIYALEELPIPTIQFFAETNDQKTSFPEVLRISNDIQNTIDIGLKQMTLNSTNVEINEQNNSNLTHNLDEQQNSSNNLSPKEGTDDDFDDFKSADSNSITMSVIQRTDFQSFANGITDNVVNDDEFADFKSADFSNAAEEPSESLPVVNKSQTKAHSLSDALMSNISAFTPISSSPQKIVVNAVIHASTTELNTSASLAEQNSVKPTETTSNINFSSGDKYSVFREISESQVTKDTEFGEFLSADNNCDAVSVDSLQFGHQDSSDNDTIESISHQIIQISRQIIRKAFNVLVVNHGQETVIEAIQSSEGNKFAFDLLEVYSIVKRVAKSLESINKYNNSLIKLVEDIDNTWKSIKSVFTKASINIAWTEETFGQSSDISNQCAICCCKASSERPVLSFAGFEYHTSCANLWLNCINPTLPQPLINCR